MLALFWYGGAPAWGMVSLGVLSGAGGLWSFRQATTGDFELHERRDISFEPRPASVRELRTSWPCLSRERGSCS